MIPHAFELVESIAALRDAAGHLLLGLDFDGTLAPIVPHPGDAAMPAEMRAALTALARRPDTWIAILSGRGLDDVARRVDLPGVFHAGNHGLEITGPGVRRVHDAAEHSRASMRELAGLLEDALRGIPGTEVEDKGLTLSVHYRRVMDAGEERKVCDVVERTCRPFSDLRLTRGKKVMEVRPDVDWHKGAALRFLRATIARGAAPPPTLFLGDDRTDEDAFRAVGADGFGIIVADPVPADTAARAHLRSPDEVTIFLRRLDGSGRVDAVPAEPLDFAP